MKDDELGKTFSDGEVIFREGDHGEVMYAIQSGQVRIMKQSPEGTLVVATLGDGEIFGEMALFDQMPRSASAVALGEVRILTIDRKKLFAGINRDPTLVFRILEAMSRRIRKLNKELTKLKKGKTDLLHLCIDTSELCSLILDEARTIIQADNGSVMLFTEESTLSIRAAFGTECSAKAPLSLGEGVAGDVLRTGRAELINNVSMDSRFIPSSMDITSLLCVPLKCKGRTFGVINMSSRSTHIFSLDDLRNLQSLAVYASLALQNAECFSHLKSAADAVLTHATLMLDA